MQVNNRHIVRSNISPTENEIPASFTFRALEKKSLWNGTEKEEPCDSPIDSEKTNRKPITRTNGQVKFAAIKISQPYVIHRVKYLRDSAKINAKHACKHRGQYGKDV